MDIIFSASLIAAFLAGMVALFAPCCITVLLPAYLASVFREKRDILKMTLVFFAGIAAVLMPIALGAAWLASVFRDFHRELYVVGGLLMIALAGFAVTGRSLAIIPMSGRMAFGGKTSGAAGVFLLGLFSGAATSCCAPVLAGAVALAVISGTFWKALLVAFAYVFGMTFPLFLAAYAYDRFRIDHSRLITGKLLRARLGSRTLLVHSTNLFAAGIFLVMGALLLTLAFFDNAFWAPQTQAEIGKTLSAWSQRAFETLGRVPDIIWGAGIIGIFLFFLLKSRRNAGEKEL